MLDPSVYVFKQNLDGGNFWDAFPKAPVEVLKPLFDKLHMEMVSHNFPTNALDVLKFINKRKIVCMAGCDGAHFNKTQTVECNILEASLPKLQNYMPAHSGAYDGQVLFDPSFLKFPSGDFFLNCANTLCKSDVNVHEYLSDTPNCTPGGPAHLIVNVSNIYLSICLSICLSRVLTTSQTIQSFTNSLNLNCSYGVYRITWKLNMRLNVRLAI